MVHPNGFNMQMKLQDIINANIYEIFQQLIRCVVDAQVLHIFVMQNTVQKLLLNHKKSFKSNVNRVGVPDMLGILIKYA